MKAKPFIFGISVLVLAIAILLFQSDTFINWIVESQIKVFEQKIDSKHAKIRLVHRFSPVGPDYVEGFIGDSLFLRCQGSSISGSVRNDTLDIEVDCLLEGNDAVKRTRIGQMAFTYKRKES